MPYTKLFWQTFGGIVIIVAAIAAFVWYVDPYQQYRAADVYIDNQRLEIPGVARHHDYDAVILGSSMCMNHYPQQIDSLFGWHTYNFTFMGANWIDYKTALPMIFGQNKARHVIWGLDAFSFARNSSLIEPYLYDDDKWNDISYLLNYTSVKNCFKKLRHPVSIKNIYHFNSPANEESLKHAFAEAQKGYFSEEEFEFETMRKKFDKSVADASLYQGIEDVHIYFPPYSIGEFVMLRDYGLLESYMEFKKYMIKQLSLYENVHIYDFQVFDWVTNLNEYMDLRHHSHKYNRRIIECIKNGEYESGGADCANQIDEFVRMVEAYDEKQLKIIY